MFALACGEQNMLVSVGLIKISPSWII